MRRILFTSALLLSCFTQSSFAKHVTLRGFVTAVHSPTSFEMDQFTILDETEQEHQRRVSAGLNHTGVPQLKPGTLRVGLEVEVKGNYDRKTGEVWATAIKAVGDDSDPDKSIEGMGLVEDKSSLHKTAQGWSGRFKADGETLVLAGETQISLKRSRAERKERQDLGLDSDDVSSFSADDIDLDTFAHYEGVRQADHSILARRIEFRQDRAATESDWSYLEPKVLYRDSKSESGALSIGQKEYELFPSPEAADYLGKLGASLIPAHQKELAEKNPGKVQFRFFLTNGDFFGVDTYPNGVIVVTANVLDTLDNEAQLAFLLSHEMARVVEKQNWTTSKYRETERKEVEAVGVAAVASGGLGGPLVAYFVDKRITRKFVRALQDQSDRVGMEYMLAAGYDPNQAVEFWRVLEKKRAKGPFWGDSDENLVRRTYIQSEVQLDYAGRDFSSLKHDGTDFRTAVDEMKAARVRGKAKK